LRCPEPAEEGINLQFIWDCYSVSVVAFEMLRHGEIHSIKARDYDDLTENIITR